MADAGDLPLFAWRDARVRAVAARRRLRRRALGIAALAALLGGTMIAKPAPRLVWNGSASAPIGLYRVVPDRRPGRGDMVIAWTPTPYRRLAAERRYLPLNVPLVKAVAALPGDHVCVRGATLYVNGRQTALRRSRDAIGRPMPAWSGCGWLRADRYLLLMTRSAASFDGRYFGPVDASLIVGRAVPLWVR